MCLCLIMLRTEAHTANEWCPADINHILDTPNSRKHSEMLGLAHILAFGKKTSALEHIWNAFLQNFLKIMDSGIFQAGESHRLLCWHL